MAPMQANAVLMLSFALGASATDLSAEYFRWPYKHSPYVVKANARDGLPDFSFYAGQSKLTTSTISCPKELQNKCTTDPKLPKMQNSHVSCGTDGLQGCSGGLTCFFDTTNVNATEKSEYLPNFVGSALAVFGKKSRKLKLTRRTILQRAIGWLAINAPYFGCKVPATSHAGIETCAEDDDPKCPQYSFTATCEGFTGMIMASPFYGGDWDTAVIKYWNLKPGDIITHHSPKGTVHFMMFREWVKVNETARVYQMGGGSGSANMAVLSVGAAKKGAWKLPWCENTDPSKNACYMSGSYKYIVEE